jgi:DNA-binding NarL/FixJ family response regulator
MTKSQLSVVPAVTPAQCAEEVRATVKVRVLLADDHALFREGLLLLLRQDPHLDVVGVASNGREAVQLASTTKPDVIILDVTMPDLNGMEATRRIRAGNPQAKILALSMHSEMHQVGRMLEAGARGYVLKDRSSSELKDAISRVAGGEIYLDATIAQEILREYVSKLDGGGDKPAALLTSRQSEVLQMISEGRTTKEIASLLDVSVKTIETYRRQIMARLDIHSVAGLTKYAVREGLTRP